MPTTNNLQLELIPSNTAQPEVLINAVSYRIDAALAGHLSFNFAANADLYLSDTQAYNAAITFTDTGNLLTTTRIVQIPSRQKLYVIRNSTAQTLTIKTASGTGVDVTADSVKLIVCDGTNCFTLT